MYSLWYTCKLSRMENEQLLFSSSESCMYILRHSVRPGQTHPEQLANDWSLGCFYHTDLATLAVMLLGR